MSDPKSEKDTETSEGLETDADAISTKSEDNEDTDDLQEESSKDQPDEPAGDGIEDAEVVEDTSETDATATESSSETSTAETELEEPVDAESTSDAQDLENSEDPTQQAALEEASESETASVETQSEPTASEPAPTQTVVEKRGGFWGPFLGGVIAAGLGFGACFYLFTQGILGTDSDTAFAEERAQITALSEQFAALQAEFDGLGEDPRVGPLSDGLSAVEGVVGALQGEVETVQAQIETQSGLLDGVVSEMEGMTAELAAIAAIPAGTGGGTADTAAVAALQAQLESQQAENAEMQGQLQEMAEAARQEMDEVRARAGALQAETQAAVDDATNRAALANITSALESGTPLAPALANLTEDVPAALSAVSDTGVMTVLELQQAFPAAARAGLSESLKVTVGDAPTDRFLAFLQAQVGARSLEAREGDDPDAVLARAQTAVSSAQFSDALAEIATLPPEGQSAMAGWTADAQARVDAIEARDALTSEMISN